MYKVIMPKLGMAQSYCVVEKWLKKIGDRVEAGDVLLEVSTDKITYEVEAKQSGYLLKTIRTEGEEVPVTEVIAYIGEKDEAIDDTEIEINYSQKSTGKTENVINKDVVDIRISALAKKFAEQNNVDLSKVSSSGPGGRIMKEDIEAYINKSRMTAAITKDLMQNGPKIHSKKPLTFVRKVISEKMTYAIHNIPHISQSTKIDVTKLVSMKEKLSSIHKNITYTDLLLKAVSIAVKENLEINSSLINNEYVIYEDINIGFVISILEGVIIPVIKNCDRKSLFEVAQERTSFIDKARQNKLSLEDLSNGTFTISNLGMYNVRSFTAIIYPPQGAILTVGKIYSSPEVVNDSKIEIKKVLELTVAVDHRILDGVLGVKFLTKIAELIENPEF